MKTFEALKSITNYPVPQRTIQRFAAGRGLDIDAEASIDVLKSNAFRLTEADLQMWVANAPNIIEGGLNFNMLVSDREVMRNEAMLVYKELGDAKYQPETKVTFGYKGDSL